MSLIGGLTATAASPAWAQEDSSSSTTPVPSAEEDPDIIPRPDSGREPEEAGDRGGALQLGLLALLLVGVGAIVALVVRDSRRATSRTSRR